MRCESPFFPGDVRMIVPAMICYKTNRADTIARVAFYMDFSAFL